MSPVSCAIIRGGTSKGVFVLDASLPVDPIERDRCLLALMGSADPRQIDGLGGGDPLTSKVAIVSPGGAPGVDLEYESVEVGIGSDFVNHGVMCGNLAAGVGLFALQEGLLPRDAPRRALAIHCRNNGKRIEARLADGRPWASADVHPGAVAVRLSFVDPVGAVTGRLLPLDEPVSSLSVDGTALSFSAVDSGTLYAFVRARDLDLAGDEAPADLDANQAFRRLMERVREEVMGRINAHLGTRHPPKRLKLAVVAPPRDAGAHAEVVARIINPARVHKAYAVSGGICLASAATVPGSVVHEVVAAGPSPWTVGITHPSGSLSVTLRASEGRITACEVERTARTIMQGLAHLPSAPRPAVTAPRAAGRPAVRTRLLQPSDLTPSHVAQWRELETRALERNAYLSPRFLVPSLELLSPGRRTWLATVWAGPGEGTLIGLGAFESCGPRRRLPLPHVSVYRSVHSFLPGILVDSERSEEAVRGLVDALESRHGVAGLCFEDLAVDGPAAKVLRQVAEERRGRWHEVSTAERACLRLQDGASARWREHVSKGRLRKMERQLRQLREIGEVRWRYLQGPEVVDETAERFLELEHRSWKGREATSLAAAPEHAEFFRRLIGAFARDGEAFFTELTLDGRLIASTSNLCSGGDVFAFKVAYDPDFGKYSPGVLNELEFLKSLETLPDTFRHVDSGAAPGSFIEGLWPDRVMLGSGHLVFGPLSRIVVGVADSVRRLKGRLSAPEAPRPRPEAPRPGTEVSFQ